MILPLWSGTFFILGICWFTALIPFSLCQKGTVLAIWFGDWKYVYLMQGSLAWFKDHFLVYIGSPIVGILLFWAYSARENIMVWRWNLDWNSCCFAIFLCLHLFLCLIWTVYSILFLFHFRYDDLYIMPKFLGCVMIFICNSVCRVGCFF